MFWFLITTAALEAVLNNDIFCYLDL